MQNQGLFARIDADILLLKLLIYCMSQRSGNRKLSISWYKAILFIHVAANTDGISYYSGIVKRVGSFT
jgi:hypothetical protein